MQDSAYKNEPIIQALLTTFSGELLEDGSAGCDDGDKDCYDTETTLPEKSFNFQAEYILEDSDTSYFRGLACADKGDYDMAIAYFNTADSNHAYFDDYNEAILYQRGVVYDKKGDYDNAIADFTAILEQSWEILDLDTLELGGYLGDRGGDNHYYSDIFCNRGLSYYNKSDYDSAVADLEKALLISPDFKPAKEYLESVRKKIQEL